MARKVKSSSNSNKKDLAVSQNDLPETAAQKTRIFKELTSQQEACYGHISGNEANNLEAAKVRALKFVK